MSEKEFVLKLLNSNPLNTSPIIAETSRFPKRVKLYPDSYLE
jgi:hypothetical protein